MQSTKMFVSFVRIRNEPSFLNGSPDGLRCWLRQTSLLLALTVVLSFPASARQVHCRNTFADAALVQKAISSSGVVILEGTCDLGSTTLSFGSGLTIQGTGQNGNLSGHGATSKTVLNYSGNNGFIFQSAGDNNTINGLTLNGGGIHLTRWDDTRYMGQTGWTITHNTIQNVVVAAGGGVIIDAVLGRGNPNPHNSISDNNFYNLWFPKYLPSANPCDKSPDNGDRNCAPHAIYWGRGLDNTSIDGNFFYQIGGNPIKGFEDWFAGYTAPYTSTHVTIRNNDIQWYGRIGIEHQGLVGKCPGECNMAAHWSTGAVISGNFIHNLAAPPDGPGLDGQFAYSLFWADNAKIINNTAINSKAHPCGTSLAYAFEWAGFDGSLFQGNVAKSVNGSPTTQYCHGGWGYTVTTGFTSIMNRAGVPACTYKTCAVQYVNNVYVNSTIPSDNNWANNEGGNHAYCFGGTPSSSCDQVTYSHIAEFMSKNPELIQNVYEGSSMRLSFVELDRASDASQSSVTWELSVVSNLSIRNVSFCFDSCLTPFAQQDLQDVNPHFDEDRRWKYHVTAKRGQFSNGTHTVTARVTDVSGTSQTITQPVSTVGSK